MFSRTCATLLVAGAPRPAASWAVIGAVCATAVVPLVWILMRTDIPFKKTIYVLLTIGILIPVFLRTIAWSRSWLSW